MVWLKRLIPAALLLLGIIQIFQPARTNPPVDPHREIHASFQIDPAVANVLSRSCNDCHSNHTAWPWYSQVAPVSWLVASDVNRGRKALNFSEWSMYGADAQRKHLSEICDEVSDREMPAFSYSLMHPGAKLSASEIAAVCRWTSGGSRTTNVGE